MKFIHKLLAIFARFFTLFKRKRLRIVPIEGVSNQRSLFNIPEMGDVIPDDDLGKALKKFRQLQADKQYESILASDEPGVTTDNYEQQVPTFVPVKQEDGSYAVEFNGKKIGMIEKR